MYSTVYLLIQTTTSWTRTIVVSFCKSYFLPEEAFSALYCTVESPQIHSFHNSDKSQAPSLGLKPFFSLLLSDTQSFLTNSVCPSAKMFSKQSLKFFKSNLAFFKGQGSQGVCMKQNLSSRSTGRLSRLDFGPKPADASCSTRNDRAGEHYRLATYPRGYQLEKKRVKAARLSKLLFPAPAPNPQPSDPFGSPNIYRAPGLRGGDSKFACACFRPTERTTSWGLADHVRRHEAQTAGIPFQWPPTIQEALPTVPFAFESLCQHCRGGHQEAQIIVHDEIMTDAPEELWDVGMYDTVIDVPMEDAPPLKHSSIIHFLPI